VQLSNLTSSGVAAPRDLFPSSSPRNCSGSDCNENATATVEMLVELRFLLLWTNFSDECARLSGVPLSYEVSIEREQPGESLQPSVLHLGFYSHLQVCAHKYLLRLHYMSARLCVYVFGLGGSSTATHYSRSVRARVYECMVTMGGMNMAVQPQANIALVSLAAGCVPMVATITARDGAGRSQLVRSGTIVPLCPAADCGSLTTSVTFTLARETTISFTHNLRQVRYRLRLVLSPLH
jgi:hypothetical protein